jgi:sterol desaturase/sphingolipid hydroxylase (fatty acid hydroxylase superfamily)
MERVLYLPIVLTGIAVSLFVLERFAPLRTAKHALIERLFINLCISALAFIVAAIAVRPAALSALRLASQTSFGLLHVLNMPMALQFALGFLLLDLTFYYWHLANHQVPWLWRFHNVHHIDSDLDVTTAFRFHGGEIALSAGFRFLQVLLIGGPIGIYVAYELIFQGNTLFHHSNVRLPIAVERLLNRVLVTPRMHGIHHSQVYEETNSNFSVVFPWWDRLHSTLRLNIPQAQVAIGIPGYSLPDDNTLRNALVMPFRFQRDYWRRPEGTVVVREPAAVAEDRTLLAV